MRLPLSDLLTSGYGITLTLCSKGLSFSREEYEFLSIFLQISKKERSNIFLVIMLFITIKQEAEKVLDPGENKTVLTYSNALLDASELLFCYQSWKNSWMYKMLKKASFETPPTSLILTFDQF